MSDLILPGHTPDPAGEVARPGDEVHFVRREAVVGPDGRLYEMRIEGTAEVQRGPLGRFLDLAAEIEAEGGRVPPEVRDVLDRLAAGG